MCPACITTAALIAGSAASTLGLGALVVLRVRAKNVNQQPREEGQEESDGQQHS
jgi:hypothetical protein